jgi:predicted Zn-dependent protease
MEVAAVGDGAAEAESPVGSETIIRAQRMLERGKADQAIELATRYTQARPQEAFGWLILGAAREQKGDRAKARETYRTCGRVAKGAHVGECRALGGGP